MANRTFFDVQSSNREVKIIATKVKIGTEPSATAVLTDSSGTDISTNGVKKAEWGTDANVSPNTGLTDRKFRITLDDKYEALLSCQVTKGNDQGGGTPAEVVEVLENVAASSLHPTANSDPLLADPSIVVELSTADLASGDEFYVTLFLLNTSVTR
jgi:hypothetical protein|tara:strand:- start:117 stop:584 length:468 start_codon:yes stop_codon:yes gene_type:complete